MLHKHHHRAVLSRESMGQISARHGCNRAGPVVMECKYP
jgi:hypothetical protein